jgi:addiction module HigA family antidote
MATKKLLPPVHPGEILREEFMAPMGLTSNALAKAIHVTPARINEIVKEQRGITADTALRLARYFNTDAQSWLNLQNHYELECARRELGRTLQDIHPRAA